MKLSQAEKERRKDKKIYDHFDSLLDRLETAYKNDASYEDFQVIFAHIIGFSKGCYLADGYKWYKRLNKRFEEWYTEHQGIIEECYERKRFNKFQKVG